MADDTIAFGPVRITFDAADAGGKAYSGAVWQGEFSNGLYDDVERVLAPRWVFDIGAHYGLTALFSHLRSPGARVVAVEPNFAVAGYLKRNLAENGVADAVVVEAFLGDARSDAESFYVRADATSGGRVRSPSAGWTETKVREETLDALTETVESHDGVYLKISAQGYEERIFRGAELFLGRHERWMARVTFHPALLRSQGTNAQEFLDYLIRRYVVAECLQRTPFGRSTISDSMRAPLVWGDLPKFVAHVHAQNQPGRGSVDLLIVPRALHAELRGRERAGPGTDIAEIKDEVRRLSETTAELAGHDLSLDIISVLSCARALLIGRRYGLETTNEAALKSSHGHVLLMLAMSELEAETPGRFAGKTLFEIGTTRERMAAQGSTEKLALFTVMLGMRFVTIDMDPANSNRARSIIRQLNPNSDAVTAKGEDFLARESGPFDVVYLDAFDFDHGRHSAERTERYVKNLGVEITDEACWRMHFDCAQQLVGKMPLGGLVVVDDTSRTDDGGFDRKGKLAVPHLLANGFEVFAKSSDAVALVKTVEVSQAHPSPVHKKSRQTRR